MKNHSLIILGSTTLDMNIIQGKQIVDTTGAGDVFLAAYLFSRIFNKQDVSDACKEAAATAAHHIEGHWITMDVLHY